MLQKGTAFRSTFAAIERTYGGEGLDAVKAALAPDVRSEIENCLPVSWYSIATSVALHNAIRQVLGGGTWDANHRLGREAARIDYTGLYRVVVRPVQYDSVFARLELTWKTYFTHGIFSCEQVDPRHTRLRISGVAGFSEGLWASSAGRTEQLIALGGASDVQVIVRKAADTEALFDVFWAD